MRITYGRFMLPNHVLIQILNFAWQENRNMQIAQYRGHFRVMVFFFTQSNYVYIFIFCCINGILSNMHPFLIRRSPYCISVQSL